MKRLEDFLLYLVKAREDEALDRAKALALVRSMRLWAEKIVSSAIP